MMKNEILYAGGIFVALGAIYFIVKQYKKNRDGSAALDDKEIVDLLKKIDSAKNEYGKRIEIWIFIYSRSCSNSWCCSIG